MTSPHQTLCPRLSRTRHESRSFPADSPASVLCHLEQAVDALELGPGGAPQHVVEELGDLQRRLRVEQALELGQVVLVAGGVVRQDGCLGGGPIAELVSPVARLGVALL